MRRKNSETSAGRLVLVRGSQSPESDGTSTKLGEPALQFRLSGVVRQTAQVKDLATLSKEGPDIGVSIHGASENLGVLVRWLGLADQAPQHTGQGDGLLHSATGGGGCQCLQVEGQVVLDGGGGLNGFNLESGADVGEGAGSKGQGLGVVGLPALIFGAQVESTRVLEVCGQHDSLVTGLAGQLDAQIPRIQSHKGKLKLLAGEVFCGKGIESGNGITESTSGANMLPSESRQTGCIGQLVWVCFGSVSPGIGADKRAKKKAYCKAA